MAYVLAERVRERTLTTGTGPISLDGVISPNQRTFVEGIGDGNTTRVCILSGNGTDWEIDDNALVTDGLPATLSRNVIFSYIGGVLGTDPVDLVGESRVFCALPAMENISSSGEWAAVADFARNSIVRFGDKRYIATEFIPAAPAGPPTIDGHAKHNGSTGSGSITVTLTTTLPDDEIAVFISINGGQTAAPTASGLAFTERGAELGGAPIRQTIGGITLQQFYARASAPLTAKVITITPTGSADFSAVAFGVNNVNALFPFDTNSDHLPLATAGNTVDCTTDGVNRFLMFADVSATLGFNETTVPTGFTLIEGCNYVPAQLSVSGRTVTTQQVGVSLVGSGSNSVFAFIDTLTSENAPPNVDPRWVPLGEDFTDQLANTFFAGPDSGGSGPPGFRAIVAADIPVMIGDSGSGGTKGAAPAPGAGDAAAGKFLDAAGGYSVPPGTGGAFSTNSDVALSGLANNDIAAYNSGSGKWTNRTVAAITALLSAVIGDSGSGGTKGLVPAPGAGDAAAGKYLDAAGGYSVPAGTGGSIGTDSDVTLTSLANNDAIIYNSGSSKWTNRTMTALTALLSAVVGDSGSGGTKGLVPAPGAGDAAAGKFLGAGGTFTLPTLGGTSDSAITSAADNDILVYISGSPGHWTNKRPLYGIAISAPQITAYTASQVLGHHDFACGVTIPANFGAYLGRQARAGGSAVAAASTIISVEKAAAATPNTFSQVGTITIAAGTVTPTFASSGGTTIVFAANDRVRFVAPATPDTTFVGFYCTIPGYQT
jgi:hypothetical protein